MTIRSSPPFSRWRWILLAGAALALNASLAFRNVWPTPKISWRGDLSVEFAACVLLFAVASRRTGSVPRGLLRVAAVVWALLVVGHYADVTAPAVYGREVNLFWDLRHGQAVVAMLADALPWWLNALLVAAVVAVWIVLHRASRWGLRRIAEAMVHRVPRRLLAGAAAVIVAAFAAQQVGVAMTVPHFSPPVTRSLARQAELFTTGFTASAAVPPPRPLHGVFSGLAGADVFLVFVESYGAVAYDDPAIGPRLSASRGRLAADIAASGRQVVSAFVESPTFGGSSWLAHISLLTGVEVRDEDANRQIMAQDRETLVTLFSRNGYRTVAAMPGNSHPWPEGAFYHFDDIYDRARLDYRGPRFGWWYVPDQFTLARFDQLEVTPRSRKPLFVLMPTISTHAPFGPVAPYLDDWERLLTKEPYPAAQTEAALARKPDLLHLGPSYAGAVEYVYRSLGGYLRRRADRDLVLIVLGDHQPAAAVSGEGARWDVPVHVIASRGAVLQRLREAGFRDGLEPANRAVGPMHALLPRFVEAFGSRVP